MDKPVFTEEEVRILNEYQQAGKYHPYTCVNDGNEEHILFEFCKKLDLKISDVASKDTITKKDLLILYSHYINRMKDFQKIPYPELEFTQTNLIATQKGWICPCCDYTQNWAHASMMGK